MIPVLISSCSSASTLSGIDTGTTENRDVLESAAEPVGVDEDESFGKCGALLSTVILCGSWSTDLAVRINDEFSSVEATAKLPL